MNDSLPEATVAARTQRTRAAALFILTRIGDRCFGTNVSESSPIFQFIFSAFISKDKEGCSHCTLFDFTNPNQGEKFQKCLYLYIMLSLLFTLHSNSNDQSKKVIFRKNSSTVFTDSLFFKCRQPSLFTDFLSAI